MNTIAKRIWSDAEVDTLRALMLQGFTDREIGNKLGRTVSAVFSIRQRRGLHRPETLCWTCQNAVPNLTGRGCEWSRCARPVRGWTAFPQLIEEEDTGYRERSFLVIQCPAFVPDPPKAWVMAAGDEPI